MVRPCDNPFRSDRINKLVFRPQQTSWDAIFKRLESLQYLAAVVGPEGSGKTTFLEQLAPRLLQRGFSPVYLRIHPERKRRCSVGGFFRGLGPEHILLADGTETLNAITWFRFKRYAAKLGGLVVSLHSPRRVPTLLECSTSCELFEELVAELIGPAAVRRTTDKLNRLFTESSGNIRDALRRCYDLYAHGGTIERSDDYFPAAGSLNSTSRTSGSASSSFSNS